jgi:uncharacterized protein YjbJ (UPF0337 family)
MNTDILKGQWKQIKGEIHKQWGKLTDDEIDVINGDREKLEGRLQEMYGYTRDQARQEVNDFLRAYDRSYERR